MGPGAGINVIRKKKSLTQSSLNFCGSTSFEKYATLVHVIFCRLRNILAVSQNCSICEEVPGLFSQG